MFHVKHFKFLLILTCFFALISPSFAFNKLTPTDILNRREYEFQFGYSLLTASQVVTPSWSYYQYNASNSTSVALASMSIGLVDGLELNIDMPYFFSDNTILKSSSGASPETYSSLGAGDLIFAATYGLRRENTEAGLLAIKVGVKPATALSKQATAAQTGAKGTGTTNTFVGFAGSRRFVSNEPYFTILYNFTGDKSKAEIENYLQWAIGNERMLNKFTNIDFRFISNLRTGASLARPYNDMNPSYQLQLSAYLDTPRKFTLIPAVSYVFENNADSAGTRTETQGWMFTLSLYSLLGGISK